jgi:3-oxoacyl-[acyl-carrier protein] reductase
MFSQGYYDIAILPCCRRRNISIIREELHMANLTGKVALVTGGSRGIGAAIAKRLAAEGACVAITYAQNDAPAHRLVQEIGASGGEATAIRADAAEADAVVAAVEEAAKRFGRLDVLVNNAGTVIGKPFEQTTLDEMDRLFDINLRGALIATQAALRHLPNGGRIITIGSCAGEYVGSPGLVTYAASKGALKMFSQALARELGERAITVNTVQPGPTDTDLNPASDSVAAPKMRAGTALKRYGHVDEIAALVAFVAGPESGFITGASLTIDGGTNA